MERSTGNQNQNRRSRAFDTRTLCAVAILTAVTAVVAYLCKFLTIGGSIRVTFENLPIILCGFVFGPLAGVMTGVAADLISTIIFYGAAQINPILTLACAVIGLIAGFAGMLTKGRPLPLRLAFAVFPAHIVGNMLIKTFGLVVWKGSFFYGRTFFELFAARAPIYAVISTVEYAILLLTLRNRGVQKALGVRSEAEL